MSNGHNLNYVIAIGLTLVAIIGIVGLIGIAATKGISADASNMGSIIAIIATAVGAIVGALTQQRHDTLTPGAGVDGKVGGDGSGG